MTSLRSNKNINTNKQDMIISTFLLFFVVYFAIVVYLAFFCYFLHLPATYVRNGTKVTNETGTTEAVNINLMSEMELFQSNQPAIGQKNLSYTLNSSGILPDSSEAAIPFA